MGAFVFHLLTCVFALTSVTEAIVLNKFSTKTVYNFSLTSTSEAGNGTTEESHCQPLAVFAVLRHGIRYPSVDDIDAAYGIVQEFRNRGASSVIVDQLEKVLKEHLPQTKEKQLSVTGGKEQHEIGFRYGSKFLRLFSSAAYDDVTFVTSSSQRAVDSCLHFQKGFSSDHRFNVSSLKHTRDDLLRFFANCPKYIKEVRKNKTALMEQYLFEDKFFHRISHHLEKHLNISELKLSSDDLNALYKVAACEVAIVGSHLWADLLRLSDLELLEYSSDLENYWKYSYGYPISYQQSCPLLADIFSRMDGIITGESNAKGVFYFGHAETVLPLATLLGLSKDPDPLRANDFHQQANRHFKTSVISPFSTNLALVLHKCRHHAAEAEQSFSTNSNKFMIQVLFQEQNVQLHHLCKSNLCSYDKVRRHYSEYIDRCDFDARCSLHNFQPLFFISLPSVLQRIIILEFFMYFLVASYV